MVTDGERFYIILRRFLFFAELVGYFDLFYCITEPHIPYPPPPPLPSPPHTSPHLLISLLPMFLPLLPPRLPRVCLLPLPSLPRTFTTTIPPSLYRLTFARSSGPGGQNANKLNTQAVLKTSVSLIARHVGDEGAERRVWERYRGLVSKKGEVIIKGQVHRTQAMNKKDVMER